MSGLMECLTKLLSAHDCYDYAGGLDCRCGESFVGDDNNAEKFWAAHVAAVLAEALGLAQVEILCRSWRAVPDYDVTPANDPRQPSDMDVAYDDAAMQIMRALGLEGNQ
jgi:hypothetical protein